MTNRERLEKAIAQGGSVIHNGRLITDSSQLPKDVENAPAVETAAGEAANFGTEDVVKMDEILSAVKEIQAKVFRLETKVSELEANAGSAEPANPGNSEDNGEPADSVSEPKKPGRPKKDNGSDGDSV